MAEEGKTEECLQKSGNMAEVEITCHASGTAWHVCEHMHVQGLCNQPLAD